MMWAKRLRPGAPLEENEVELGIFDSFSTSTVDDYNNDISQTDNSLVSTVLPTSMDLEAMGFAESWRGREQDIPKQGDGSRSVKAMLMFDFQNMLATFGLPAECGGRHPQAREQMVLMNDLQRQLYMLELDAMQSVLDQAEHHGSPDGGDDDDPPEDEEPVLFNDEEPADPLVPRFEEWQDGYYQNFLSHLMNMETDN